MYEKNLNFVKCLVFIFSSSKYNESIIDYVLQFKIINENIESYIINQITYLFGLNNLIIFKILVKFYKFQYKSFL